MVSLACGTGAYFLARFTDQAFADTLGLRTLRHGTDPVTWLKIHLRGSSAVDDKSKFIIAYFTVCNPTDAYGIDFSRVFANLFPYDAHPVIQLATKIYAWVLENQFIVLVQAQIKKYSPFLYSFFFESTPLISLFRKCVLYTTTFIQKSIASYELVKNSGKFRFIATPVAALLTPSIKYRFREDQILGRFRVNDISNVTLSTQDYISPLDVGLVGSLKNGVRITLSPLFNQPVKVLTGVGKLALAGAAMYAGAAFFPGFIVAHRTAMVAGALIAVI